MTINFSNKTKDTTNMEMTKNPLRLAITTGLSTIFLSACGGGSDNSFTPEPASRFQSQIAANINGGGELLIDTEKNLTWINGGTIDSNDDGCIAPTSPIEPADADDACFDQTYGGFNDWRVPTTAELSNFIESAVAANVTMNYLNPLCPALLSSDSILRTENANPAATTAFPNAQAGGIIGTTLVDLAGTNVRAGVRCVRDGTEDAPVSLRFVFKRATDDNASGRTLVDTNTNLEWINQATLDTRGDGCVSPQEVGPTEPAQANSRCDAQNFAGHDDWRAPTTEESKEILVATEATNGVALRYLIAACPAIVSTSNIIRTENANPNASAAFPNANTGDVLGVSLSEITTAVTAGGGGPVGAGVRCVRNVTP